MEACYSPQQHNVTSYGATTVAITTLEAFAGMWINAFIVSVLCIGWIKKKTLNSNEKILLLLGCSRNSFFIYLKVKIDRMVPWLFLGSGILSLAIGIIAYDVADKPHCNNLNSTGQGNFGSANIKMDTYFFPSFFLTGFEYAASFMAVIFAAVFLLFSLWRHKCKMQTNSMKDLSMEAHIRAMKSIFSFLVMYSINFVCLVLKMVYVTKKGSYMTFLIVVFQYTFPSLHSLILIFSNPKLEKTLLKILPLDRSVKRKKKQLPPTSKKRDRYHHRLPDHAEPLGYLSDRSKEAKATDISRASRTKIKDDFVNQRLCTSPKNMVDSSEALLS
ncbi:hypothetical protein DUI87_05701 [Hirundo rustica rustica]|uniref:Taste receptor type 2 n=1 Tax=Hirundo rustica rustica TaxID=333673 RepID=A0A3M0L044_HIRRU|nr:hypothetical protein DUI87_05701 [Hirundo rustica rustica]